MVMQHLCRHTDCALYDMVKNELPGNVIQLTRPTLCGSRQGRELQNFTEDLSATLIVQFQIYERTLSLDTVRNAVEWWSNVLCGLPDWDEVQTSISDPTLLLELLSLLSDFALLHSAFDLQIDILEIRKRILIANPSQDLAMLEACCLEKCSAEIPLGLMSKGKESLIAAPNSGSIATKRLLVQAEVLYYGGHSEQALRSLGTCTADTDQAV